MSEPTIRISTCRGGGRCPECGEESAFPFRLLCGCSPCLSSACSLNHTRALLTEAIRQLHMQELCTFDANGHADAAIKDMEALREERDAAIARVEFQAAELRNRDEALARVVRERDAAIRRADRDEALLREIAAVPLVGLTLGSVLLAKIREALQ